MEATHALPFLTLAAVYARPLYVFQRDDRGTLTMAISKTAPGGWVFSALVRVDEANGGIEKLVALCRSDRPEDKERVIAKLAFNMGQEDPAADAMLDPFAEITVGLLRLALNEAVRAAVPLTASEMIKTVRACPFVLVNWVVSFNSKDPAAYVAMCSVSYEANWMHALLADIGRDFPDFNRAQSAPCALALNTAARLTRLGKPDVALPESCYATPRCMYTTAYLTESNTNTRNEASIMKLFAEAHMPPSLAPHSVSMLKNHQARAFETAFLANSGYPGLATIEKDLKYSFPVNLTMYYDVLCQYYRKVLFMAARVTDFVALDKKVTWRDGAADITLTRILPMPQVYVDRDPVSGQAMLRPDDFFPLNHVTHSDDGQPDELMRSSTLSELVKSHFYVTKARGTLRL